MSDYSKKLRDPRWQSKRLEILARDKYKCTKCTRKDVILHVHHLKYKGEPWDVDNKHLITVCHICHFIIHKPYLIKIGKAKPELKAVVQQRQYSKIYTYEKEKAYAVEQMSKSNESHLNLFAFLVLHFGKKTIFKKSINDKNFGDYIRKNPHGISDSLSFLLEDKCIEVVKTDQYHTYYRLTKFYSQAANRQKIQDRNINIINYFESQT